MGQTKPIKPSQTKSVAKKAIKKPASNKVVPAVMPVKAQATAKVSSSVAVPRAPLTTMDRIRKELLRRKEEIHTYQHDIEAHGASSNDEPGDLADRSEEAEVWVTRESMNQHLSEELRHIDTALARMNSGEFGICVACEESIPMNRLRARPNATLCLTCQEITERHNGPASRRPSAHNFTS